MSTPQEPPPKYNLSEASMEPSTTTNIPLQTTDGKNEAKKEEKKEEKKPEPDIP